MDQQQLKIEVIMDALIEIGRTAQQTDTAVLREVAVLMSKVVHLYQQDPWKTQSVEVLDAAYSVAVAWTAGVAAHTAAENL